MKLDPHLASPISITALIRIIVKHYDLIFNLIKREIALRYRGSSLGIFWSFFNPILMLIVYTFVFSVIFKARWVGGSDSKVEFALILFVGLMVFNLFSECISRAPTLILSNVNYVKKVIFPLEVLPIVVLGTALFHFLISLFIWIIFYLVFIGLPHIEILLLPLILIPLLLFTLGLSWFLASLGVYLRDMSQIIGIFVTLMMFLSAIFYPVSALPESLQPLMLLNPLTLIIEQTRDIMIWGKGFNFSTWIIQMLSSALVAWGGFIWFQKTRKGFADVL
jgi:lipopolysaccharide transport system permease protein